MANVLEKIVMYKRKEIAARKKAFPLEKFKRKLKKSKHSFKKSLKRKNFPALIAEIKFASPSEGKISSPKNLVRFTKLYSCYASAVSVLTDEKFFSGSLQYLKKVSKAAKLPVLRKDFILDEYQIYEARYYGADAVLLIAALLSKKQIDFFLQLAKKLSMDCLVEVRSRRELRKVLKTKAEIVGINNRNLKTLKVDLNTTKKLVSNLPKSKLRKLTVVSESGINSAEDIFSLPKEVDAVLVGTAILKSRKPGEKLRELVQIPKIKICALTNLADAKSAFALRADYLGFLVNVSVSRNSISATQARKIFSKLPKDAKKVVLTDNSSFKKISRLYLQLKPQYLQLVADVPVAVIKKLRKRFPAVRIMKTIHVTGKVAIAKAKKYEKYVDVLVLDSKSGKQLGGTGKFHNLNISAKIVKASKKPVFLAGGLTAGNVCSAIRKVKLFAVDVGSGVAATVRKKDYKKMKAFIREVRTCSL